MAGYIDPPAGGAPITGNHPSLNNPPDATALATQLEASWRPYLNAPGLAAAPHVGDWSNDDGGVGNDDTGNGTLATPFATIEKMLQMIGTANFINLDVLVAGGASEAARQVVPVPELMNSFNWVTLRGLERDGDVATQVGAANIANAEEIEVIVTGLTSGTADAIKGRIIEWTSGPANGRRGNIRHSDVTGTTGAGQTVVTVTQDDATSQDTPAAGNTFKLVEMCTELSLPRFFTIAINCVQFNIRSCILGSGTNRLFMVNTDKIGLRDVRTEMETLQVGSNGGVELFNTYLANTGNPNRAMLSCARFGRVAISFGSTIDCNFTGSVTDSRRFVEFQPGSQLGGKGNSVFQGLGTKGVQCDGAQIASDDPLTAHDVHSFDKSTCVAGYRINGQVKGAGGNYQLFNGQGQITETFFIEAADGAVVEVGAATSVRTVSGAGDVNAGSGDGGATASSGATDGTVIKAADPVFGSAVAMLGNDYVYKGTLTGVQVVIGTDGRIDTQQAAATSGTPAPGVRFIGGAHTGLANLEANDWVGNFNRLVTFGTTDTLPLQRSMRILNPTYASSAGAKIITTAATFAIEGAPIAGTDVSIDNPLSLYVVAGNSAFGGDVGVGTLSPGYGAATRALTVEGATDSAVELSSLRAQASGVLIGSVDAQYRTNSTGHQLIGQVQFLSDGSTAGQRGGRVRIMVKADGATSLSEAARFEQNLDAAFIGNVVIAGGKRLGVGVVASTSTRFHAASDTTQALPTITTGTVGIFQRSNTSLSSRIFVMAGNSGLAAIDFGDTGTQGAGRIEYLNGTESMTFFASATRRMIIDQNAQVAVGATSISDVFGGSGTQIFNLDRMQVHVADNNVGVQQRPSLLLHNSSQTTNNRSVIAFSSQNQTPSNVIYAQISGVASARNTGFYPGNIVFEVRRNLVAGMTSLLELSGSLNRVIVPQSTITTETGMRIGGADLLTSGTMLNIISNSSDTSARSLFQVVNDNAAAVGAVPFLLQQDADVAYMRFIGASTGGTVTDAFSTLATAGAQVGWVQVQIATTRRWIRIFADPSA